MMEMQTVATVTVALLCCLFNGTLWCLCVIILVEVSVSFWW